MLSLMLVWVAYRIPLEFWKRNGMLLMLSSIVLLGVVLLPGVGHTVNGSTRWLNFGFFTFQISEIAKLFLIIYLSGYLIRRSDEVQSNTMGFLKPMVVLAFASGLLIMEPDFGAAAILLLTRLGLMFLGGVKFGQFMVFVFGTLTIMVLLAMSSEYRMARITSFLDPWADPFNSGFQLTQSLIAIGNGGWFGSGLGGSIQKLFYLPEAHTDFLFAIFAEEFGLGRYHCADSAVCYFCTALLRHRTYGTGWSTGLRCLPCLWCRPANYTTGNYQYWASIWARCQPRD